MTEITLKLSDREIELLRNSTSSLGIDDAANVSLQLKIANALLDAKYLQKVNSKITGSLSDFPAFPPVHNGRFWFRHVGRNTLVAYHVHVTSDTCLKEVVYVSWAKCSKYDAFSETGGVKTAWDRLLRLRETGQVDPLPKALRHDMNEFLQAIRLRYKDAHIVVSQ